jgi:hypothetical protein
MGFSDYDHGYKKVGVNDLSLEPVMVTPRKHHEGKGLFSRKDRPDIMGMSFEELSLRSKRTCYRMNDVLGGMVAGDACRAVRKYHSDEMKKHREFLRMVAAVFGLDDPESIDDERSNIINGH